MIVLKGQYPGGKPVRHPPKAKGYGSYNTPLDGYVTPRLKPKRDVETVAIGFTADILDNSTDDT